MIPQNRINPLGQKMLRLLPEANNVLRSACRSRSGRRTRPHDLTPVHGRTNHVAPDGRGVDPEDPHGLPGLVRIATTTGAGTGSRRKPGSSTRTPRACSLSTTLTQVLKPTVVNETSFGDTHNRWGFKAADDFDYPSLYRSNLGIDPPGSSRSPTIRIRPSCRHSGDCRSTSGPTRRVQHHRRQSLGPGELPRRHGTSVSDEPIPRLNRAPGSYCNDDLSLTQAGTTSRWGSTLEDNMKTEPGSADYMGNFNFGHDANNPLSTGNGYANMLLGNYTLHRADQPVDRTSVTGRTISTCRTTGGSPPAHFDYGCAFSTADPTSRSTI